MKTCIFIVGDRRSGKTSTIKSLTGCSRNGLWTVRSLNKKPLMAFVVLSAITELGGNENPPNKFPDSLEKRFDVNRNKYKILICPFELNTWEKYSLDKYIQNARSQSFHVKVAVIEKDYSDSSYDISNIRDICKKLKTPLLILNITNDYNEESRKIRKKFYPK
ncbi:MAG: hypothetical protein Q7J35_13700 [Candidatus Methanoperedens sp.]|nr:hypothetical protein [Candidatus Methanoperedens sp.]